MSVSPSPTIFEVLNQAKQGIRVEFRWTGDRFAHTIHGVCGADSVPLLESIEGTADESLFVSPPFTELHQQGDAMFLTGATTSAHWSMSIESRQHGAHAQLIFDVACRLKSENVTLGCHYQPVDATFIKQVDETAIATLAVNNNSYSVVIKSPSKGNSPDCLATCRAENLLEIGPTQKTPSSFPTTIQWKYSVVWSPG